MQKGNKDQFFDFISAKLEIDVELSLTIGDDQSTFEFLVIAQSNFPSKVT